MFDENWEWGKERWKDLCAEDTGDHCSGQSSTLWPINQKNTLGQVFYWDWDWDYLIWQNWPKKQSILWQEKQFCDSKKDKFVTKRNKQFCEEKKRGQKKKQFCDNGTFKQIIGSCIMIMAPTSFIPSRSWARYSGRWIRAPLENPRKLLFRSHTGLSKRGRAA